MSDTLGSVAARAAQRLLPVCGSDAAFEARQLVGHVCGMRLDMSCFDRIFPGKYSELNALIERRLSGEPLQYILGEWDFMGLSFTVSPVCLIPRQDTETLVEQALMLIRQQGYSSCLDICTGSGCIAVSIAKLGGIAVTACDISPECVGLALQNAERNGVELTALTADLFTPAQGGVLPRFDIITANPPYIPTGELDRLQAEVRHEPRLALDGGADGLNLYRRIARDCRGHLYPNGTALVEVGCGQAAAVQELFRSEGFGHTSVMRDLCGKECVVCARA